MSDDDSDHNSTRKRCNLNDYAVPLTLNTGMLPNKSDVNKKWSDRCITHYNYTSSFIYEIVYPSLAQINFPQPLSLKPYVVKSSIGSTNSIECCVVSDQQNFVYTQQIVHPGDIVLKVNDTDVFGVYNYQDSIDQVLDPTIHRTIKFFRPSALTQNLLPSIAEIKLFMEERGSVAKFNVNINSALSGYSYDLVSHDPTLVQFPVITKMLKKQRIQWDVLPGQEKYIVMSGMETYSTGNNGKWIPYGKLRRGIYGDRDKYIAVGDIPFFHVATDSSVSRRFYLGRFNSDEVALNEIEKERELRIVNNNTYKLDVPHPNPNSILLANSNNSNNNSSSIINNSSSSSSINNSSSSSSSSSSNIPNFTTNPQPN